MSTNLFQDPTEKQLQQQSDQLAKLQQQSEKQKKQLEAKLQHHFQEAIKELSEVIVHTINNSRNITSGLCWWLLTNGELLLELWSWLRNPQNHPRNCFQVSPNISV